MNTNKNTPRIVGALFLTAIITNIVGSEMVESLIESPDYLTLVSANKTQVILGVLLETICNAAVVGIPVMIFPVLKQYNETVAQVYLGFRIMEATLGMVILIVSLSIVSLSEEFVKAGLSNPSYHQTMGALLLKQRYWGYALYIITFSFSSPLFYFFLFKSKLIPRFISVWGLIGILILVAGVILDMFGLSTDMIIYGAVLGLNEIFLGIWLIIKGFNSASIAYVSVPKKIQDNIRTSLS